MIDKKYKNGLVLGSFEPPHMGHLHLIDTAIKHSENVHVFVCHRDTDEIDGEFRYESLRYLYSNNPNVKVYNVKHYHDDYPGEFGTSIDEFYELWINEVYSRISKLDVVFTSEKYGEEFANYLEVDHFSVDEMRSIYPISGTDIRKNPFDNWDFIPDIVKPYFTKKVVLVGSREQRKNFSF